MSGFKFNQTLKFSFGHIIAFVALIGISYVSFMGATYYLGGDFVQGLYVAGGVFLLLALLLYAIQLLKATERNFQQRVRWERMMIVVFILACSACSLPFGHFWTIVAKGKQIEEKFALAMTQSKAIFDSYEEYTKARRLRYEESLKAIAGTGEIESEDYKRVGFLKYCEAEQIGHMLLSMDMRLTDSSYTRLRDGAGLWIDEVSTEPSIYNIFLLGNVKSIREAIISWYSELYDRSRQPMSAEREGEVAPFDPAGDTQYAALSGLSDMEDTFSEYSMPPLYALAMAFVLFLLLSLPYHMQPRNTKAKNFVSFWGKKKASSSKGKGASYTSEATDDGSSSGGAMGKAFKL